MKRLSDRLDNNKVDNEKVLFIHGRPAPHPMHKAFARAVNSEFIYVDHALEWHGTGANFFIRYISYILSAILLPNRHRYQFFISEGFHFMPMLLKTLMLIKKNKKVIYLLDDEGLYFIHAKKYSNLTIKLVKYFINKSDAVICVGQFQTSLARAIIKEKKPLIFTTFNGIEKTRMNKLLSVYPDLDSNNIVFVGNGPGGWRLWYKGLDVMIEGFILAKKRISDLTFTIIGEWDETTKQSLLANIPERLRIGVRFLGVKKDLESYFSKSALYLHVARGEAWGISITEAMASGLPSIVSDLTGAGEIVKKVSSDLLADASPEDICEKILWFFHLSKQEKQELSLACRNEVKAYTRENATKDFVNIFERMKSSF